MSITKSLPEVEEWLDADAEEWSSLPDAEYKGLVRRWRERFLPLIDRNTSAGKGKHAVFALEACLPTNLYVISGVKVPRLANTGGNGAAAFRAYGLRRVQRKVVVWAELILVSVEFNWSCVFSHEADAFCPEEFYVV